jgi:two-component system sensor histidine kinase CreC
MNEKDFIQSKNNILESNFRMTKIIDSLLQLSLLEQPDKNLKKDKFNIKEAIANILNDPDIEKKIKDKNISIKKINLNVFLEGNQALIEMCLSNVLNNAIDFSFKDKDISIKVIETEENISIKILDKGVGIPDNILDKIQDKFVSTSRPYTKKRSTGLGLNLVKIIMELHDGIFEINNRQDVKGVVAKLTFSK